MRLILLALLLASPVSGATLRFNSNLPPGKYVEFFAASRQADGSYREIPGAIVSSEKSDPVAPHVTRITVNVPDGTVVRIHARRTVADKAIGPPGEQVTVLPTDALKPLPTPSGTVQES